MRKAKYLFVLLLVNFISSCKSNLSKEEELLVFDSFKFKEPITIDLPFESDFNNYLNIVNRPTIVDNSFIPAVTFEVTTDKNIKRQNQNHVNFLEEMGVISLRRLQQTTINRFGEKTADYDFIFYTDRITNHESFVNRRDKANYNCNLLNVARREFLKVESFKKLTGSGLPKKEISFTYKVVPLLNYIRIPDKIFNGVAIIAKSNEKEGWNLESINWSDSGSDYVISENRNSPVSESIDISNVVPQLFLPKTDSAKFYGIKPDYLYSDVAKDSLALTKINPNDDYDDYKLEVFPNLNSKYFKLENAAILFDNTSKVYWLKYEINLSDEILPKREDLLNNIDSYLESKFKLPLLGKSSGRSTQKTYANKNYGMYVSYDDIFYSKNKIEIMVYFQGYSFEKELKEAK